MPSAPERLNAHELLTEFESTIDISSIDASFVMRQFTWYLAIRQHRMQAPTQRLAQSCSIVACIWISFFSLSFNFARKLAKCNVMFCDNWKCPYPLYFPDPQNFNVFYCHIWPFIFSKYVYSLNEIVHFQLKYLYGRICCDYILIRAPLDRYLKCW